MKKQILFLTFFVLALIAGTSTTFGQAVHWSDPRPFTCTDDAFTQLQVNNTLMKQWVFQPEVPGVFGLQKILILLQMTLVVTPF
jgi:hypothetical protein